MLVKDRMSTHFVAVGQDTHLAEALRIMQAEKVHGLLVLDEEGKLIGVVSERDLLYASPSLPPALSIYELHYQISRMTVGEVMSRKVVTIEEDALLEEAARVMADHGIGSLPVVREGKPIGIITETGLFKTFVELLGAREKGLRLALLVPERKGMLASLSAEIARLGGNIVTLGTFLGEDPTTRLLVVKVQEAPRDELLEALQGVGAEVVGVWET